MKWVRPLVRVEGCHCFGQSRLVTRNIAGVVICALIIAGLSGLTQIARADSEGADAMQTGHFREGAIAWRNVATAGEKGGDVAGECNALNQLAECDVRVGDYSAAIAALTYAIARDGALNKSGPNFSTVNDTSLKLSLAQAYVLARSDSMGMDYLGQAQGLLDQLAASVPATPENNGVRAAISNVRGSLFLARRQPLDAAQAYQATLDLMSSDDKTAVAQAAANAALSYLAEANAAKELMNAGNTTDAPARLARAVAAGKQLNSMAWDAAMSGSLPLTHSSGFLFLTLGQSDEGFQKLKPDPKALLQAFAAYDQARKIAQVINDPLIETYALGYIGHLYEMNGRKSEAMQLTNQATFIAQTLQIPDPLYRWQWQTARLLRSEDRNAAIEAYKVVAATLQSIQTDLAAGGGNGAGGVSFRQAAGDIYYEWADLQLRQAAEETQDLTQQDELRVARETIENLKTAELENYFQERCDKLIQQRSVAIDAIDPHTAVIYFVPLEDRVEILVGISDPAEGGSGKNITHISRTQTDVRSEDLTPVVRRFSREVRRKATEEYAEDGKQLYQWLISPIESLLATRGGNPKTAIDTMVFVPDGVLRSVPMCALEDEDRNFLCEKYAVAISPGLRLTQRLATPNNVDRSSGNTQLLISGLSVARLNYSALPNVVREVHQINKGYGGNGMTLLNEKFIASSINSDMQDTPYSIVHIASHGHFGGDPKDTFVLSYDTKMDLDYLERMIEPGKFRDRPVDLLTLSACDTAVGDDRSALGLAGIAVKAGALSALATLWSIEDDSTSIIIPDFYSHLREPDTSKAKALMKAQVELMKNKRFRHPYYWSAYLIVGNWE